jgi:prefoldin subunit 5
MEAMIEKLDKRIAEIKESLTKVQNNANAHIGAIQELERLKAEIEKQVV